MEKLTETFTMGGYGTYVWPSFILAAFVMALMVTLSVRSLRKAQKALAQLQEPISNA